MRRSGIHGRGLFAARALAAGERVLEYTGERVGKAESRRRQRARRAVWIFELNRRHDLDGHARGNPARFINHSCAPNCEVMAERGRVWIYAAREIAAGEELTFDYGYRLAAFLGHPCRCGAAGCTGYIVSGTERWRVGRWLGRAGRSLVGTGRKMVKEGRA
jgi:hypothetical protein